MSIETNCFRISGLDALTVEYRLYKIAGLHRDSLAYYGNVQRLVRQLSFRMRAPVTTYKVEGETFLAVPAESGDSPDRVRLGDVVAILQDTGEVLKLDFITARPELDSVRLRFL